MLRCIELAKLGAGYVAPNPMVGAVLVHEGKIIGEGYHRQYGKPHAEVNCIDSVQPAQKALISQATLYVSLEPCAHFGKTPPCADLIINLRIPRVVVGCKDPFTEVDGKGIARLKAHGIEVITPILEEKCQFLNRRFFHFYTKKRPFVILKWAQTINRKIAYPPQQKQQSQQLPERLLISNALTNRLVHQWRSEEAAILVGTNTALADDPSLTTRLWTGPNPMRIVIDRQLRLPTTLRLFDRSANTIVFNNFENDQASGLVKYKIDADTGYLPEMMRALYDMKVLSIIVEGGAQTLQSCINAGCWDEARIITNNRLMVTDGIDAPVLHTFKIWKSTTLESDTIQYLQPM